MSSTQGDELAVSELDTHRRISIRSEGDRVDVVAPVGVPIGRVLVWAGVPVRGTTTVIRERFGVQLDPHSDVEMLQDGDVLAVVQPQGRTPQKKRLVAPVTDEELPGEPSAAWWAMGVAGLLLTAFVALVPALRPEGVSVWAAVVLVLAALASGVFLVTRARRTATAGTVALAPATLMVAAAVMVSPPDRFSIPVTVATAAAVLAIFAYGLAAISRYRVTRAQLTSVGAIAVGLGVVHTIAAGLALPEPIAAAVCIGVAPLVLRALPSFLMDVPPGMFIDFAKHQQMRWAVRERMPEVVDTVDGSRVLDLVARSRARLITVTVSVSVIVIVCAPIVFIPLRTYDILQLIGQSVLAAAVVLSLSLGARRQWMPSVKWALRAAAAVVLACASLGAAVALPETVRMAAAIVLLVIGFAVVAGLVSIGKGARSLYWSRFADRVEACAVAFALPASLLAAGLFDIIRGMVN